MGTEVVVQCLGIEAPGQGPPIWGGRVGYTGTIGSGGANTGDPGGRLRECLSFGFIEGSPRSPFVTEEVIILTCVLTAFAKGLVVCSLESQAVRKTKFYQVPTYTVPLGIGDRKGSV